MTSMCAAHSSGDCCGSLSPSRLNQRFTNDGTKIAKYHSRARCPATMSATLGKSGNDRLYVDVIGHERVPVCQAHGVQDCGSKKRRSGCQIHLTAPG